MKGRYLAFYSYIGTPFRASQKLWFKEGKNYPDHESVQGIMELSLLKLKLLNYPNITLSSRTDGGVHAINTSAHFDLERSGTDIYKPEYVAFQMNKFFLNTSTPVFVRKCIQVPNNFSARFHAVSRTYLYRQAVLKDNLGIEKKSSLASFIPVEEWKRCHFTRLKGFDIDQFKEGAKHFEGYHDFTTFKRYNKLNSHKNNRRKIFSVTVRSGKPLVTCQVDSKDDVFDYWDIEIKGRAFVHNQIRRMIGTLNAVAVGKLRPEDVKLMLQVPSKHSWHSFIRNCPPEGLYLLNVEYNPEDFICTPDVKDSDEIADVDSDSD